MSRDLPTDARRAIEEAAEREYQRDLRREALDRYIAAAAASVRYLDQGTVWHPRPPAQPILVKDMDPEWRFNSAAMLLRNAAAHAAQYGWGELAMPMPDDVLGMAESWDQERTRNPQRWMRTTPLFRALVRGLPGKRNRLLLLAGKARHFNACPMRRTGTECTCEHGPGPLADDAIIRSIAGTAREIRKAEERAAKRRKAQAESAAAATFVEDWFAANPGVDPDTKNPWGIDADGFDHNEPHSDGPDCHADSCSYCYGYHCAYYCAEARGGEDL